MGHLREHQLHMGCRSGFVFGRDDRTPADPDTAYAHAREALAAAAVGVFLSGRPLAIELEELSLHEARHTYASLMIAAEVNAKALCAYMGRSSVTITYDR